MGDTKGGPFDVSGDQARAWLRLPSNPNGQPNADVLKPWVNGMDLTRRPAGKWIVDFGWTMPESDAALYEKPYRWVRERVHPMRQQNRRAAYREYWWRHVEPRQGMWRALDGLTRYIATARVAKHRLFVRLVRRAHLSGLSADRHRARRRRDVRYPAQPVPRALVAPALHVTRQGERPALHAEHDVRDVPVPGWPDAERAGRQLRGRPAGDRRRRGRPAPRRAARPVAQSVRMGRPGGRAGVRIPAAPRARDEVAARALWKRTLTNLYNDRPQWLVDAHAALDGAVAAAYGWPADISDDDALRELLVLNSG